MGRPALAHGSKMYPKIAVAKLNYTVARAEAEAEAARIVADKIALARAALVAEVQRAFANGASISKICEAYGTKDRRTIYDMLGDRLATPAESFNITTVLDTPDWPDVLSGSRKNATTWTVRTTAPVPPGMWTYPDVFERAPIETEPWEGELDFIVDDQGPLPVPSGGNPLQREWQAQNPALIQFVNKIVTES